MYFIKSNGVNYIRYDFNPKNHLKFFVFERTKKLDKILIEWNNLKEKLNYEF